MASAAALGACGGEAAPASVLQTADAVGTTDATLSGDAPATEADDPSEALFQTDHVVEVEIRLDPVDWAALRAEPKQIGGPHITCGEQPAERPYTYFPGEITVDGVTVFNVGIRKKGGFGSLSATRPGLKIKASKFQKGQRIFGLKRLTLNNNAQDSSLISQCLGYGLFADAGVPAARCGFAHVAVNGEDLGIYSNVETLKKAFLRRHFADDSGRLYESGGDFAPGSVLGFQPKTNKKAPDCSDLGPVAAAVVGPASAFVDALEAVVDVDAFLTYWAMEVLTDHWDGYANNQNNYFFYHDPTSDRLHFIPWGIDALFSGRQRSTRPLSVYACGRMAWRLYDTAETRIRYLARLRALIGAVWSETAIIDTIDRMETLLSPYVTDGLAADWLAEVQKTRDFVTTRAGRLLSELDAGEPEWPYAADDSCRIIIGDISASFDTTWQSLDTYVPNTGTMDGKVGDTTLSSDLGFANAGFTEEGMPMVRVFAPMPDGRTAVVFATVRDPASFTPGTLAVDLVNVSAMITFYDPATDSASGGGLILGGSLTFSAAQMTPTGHVRGTLSGKVLEL